MLKNYIKIAFRNLWRQKGYSFINIAGLAIGIAVCFTIFLWVQDEMSHDSFHDKSELIYRPLWDGKFGDNEWVIPAIPVPVGATLESEFPEVEHVTNLVVNSSRLVRLNDEIIRESDVIFADQNIFDVFTFRFLYGNAEGALTDPNSVVLSSITAQKYFGNENPLGQTLELSNGELLQVTAVVEPWPDQSHMQFSMIEPINTLTWVEQRKDQWASATVRTFFVLNRGENVETVQEKFNRYVKDNVTGEGSVYSDGNYSRFPFQPLTDIHLYSRSVYGMDGGGDIRYVILFTVIGVFILLLACINFINLTTARSARRMKEIGLRKVLGSMRPQLIRQFLSESFLYVAFAVLFAVLLTELSLPLFNELSGKEMKPDYIGNPMILLLLIGISLLVGLLAGGFPAIHLSSFIPVRALKGQLSQHMPRNRFRNGLVVLQFCVSITLIIGTIVVHNQLSYMQNSRLGFDQEQVIVIPGAGALSGRHDTFIREIENTAGVVSASAVQTLPGYFFDSTLFEPEQPANYEMTSLNYVLFDYNAVDVLGLNIVQGRNFSREFATDSSAYLINQAAAEALGWDEPVGKTFATGGEISTVIGVVEDFHFESLHSEIKPLIMPFMIWTPQLIAVRLAPGQVRENIESVRQLWTEFAPQRPFEYTFLDENLQRWYQNEDRVSRLFNIFTILALFIAGLGLFGLAAYAAEVRTKEIGVRKVLGATVVNITGLMSKDFIRLVLVAFAIAIPLGWFAMSRWLENFAYRIEISWWVFALAGGLAMVIALVTVSFQAIKAAMMDPVKSLRSE
jgi:putative ABC transport system permease protein